jgi:hypothetical protein
MNKLQQILCLSAIVGGTFWPARASAGTVYTVTANTSSISGQDGFLDLQFEPSPGITNLATVTVTGFATNGTVTGAAILTGDVTGQLPATVAFDNQTVFNDYFQETTFGTTEMFTVTLNGPTPLGGSASAFNIAFLASDGTTSLLTTSPDGEAGQILLNSDGTTSAQTFLATPGGQAALTIASSTMISPEPASIGLIGLSLGLASLWIGRSRIRRSTTTA